MRQAELCQAQASLPILLFLVNSDLYKSEKQKTSREDEDKLKKLKGSGISMNMS